MQNVSPTRPRSTRTAGTPPGRVPRRGLAALVATGAGVFLLFNFKTPDTVPFTALAGSNDGGGTNSGAGLGVTPKRTLPATTGPVPAASLPDPADTPQTGGDNSVPTGAPATTPAPTEAPAPTDTPKATTAPAKQVLTGQEVDTQFGPTQVQVTEAGGKIVAVKALQLPYDRQRSAQISQIVEPYLHDETLQAQSANIDLISGATYTSMAYAQSLQSALDQAK